MVPAVYAELLRKLLGRQPEVVDLFCGEGGVSEGIRRAGLAPNGVDAHDMPRYRDPGLEWTGSSWPTPTCRTR